MKCAKNLFYPVFILLMLLVVSPVVMCQMLDTKSSVRIELLQSNERFPAWSEDGKQLVFQSDRNEESNIFLYDLVADTLIQVTSGTANKSHPVFIPGHSEIAYDILSGGWPLIFKINLESGEQKRLFRRKLFCKSPSFSPSGRVVAFIGYDRKSETWQIFSYDFVYDNLNQLTHFKNEKLFRPMFSPDGKIILFSTQETEIPYSRILHQINWYGDKVQDMDTIAVTSYCWLSDSYRIVCSLKKSDSDAALITIRKDGTSVMLLCNDTIQRDTPALSSDGKKIAVAVKFGNNFDIVIYNLLDE